MSKRVDDDSRIHDLRPSPRFFHAGGESDSIDHGTHLFLEYGCLLLGSPTWPGSGSSPFHGKWRRPSSRGGLHDDWSLVNTELSPFLEDLCG